VAQLNTVENTDEPSLKLVDDIRSISDRSFYERRLKRAFDLIAGLLILLAFSPLVFAIALLVRLRLGKGVLYSQERVGAGQRPFTIYKFRTMGHDRRQAQLDIPRTEDRRGDHKSNDDPRHTRIGRALRRFSLDELPQLINVVRGEMSLVGPRPEVVEVAKARGYHDHPRHDVKPGMTGPFQVSELRLSGDLSDGLHLDAEYVETVSFGSDLKYLFKTVAVMFRGSTGS